MSKKVSKEIEVLSEHEHILSRPTIYVGSVKSSDEEVVIIKDGKINSEIRTISVGMYKLFDEVFSNSIDEAKRMKAEMEYIKVIVNSKNNEIIIEDSGEGFLNASKKNKKSNLSNVETAVSMLRAGSNFNNEDINETLIGTNGMGISLVNALSSKFIIETINNKEKYHQEWINFKSAKPIIQKRKNEKLGTTVTFIPLEDIFDNCKWDIEILRSILILKKRTIKNEPKTKNIKIYLTYNDKEEIIEDNLFSEFNFNTNIGELLLWGKNYQQSSSISFINGAQCTGIHQKIINDKINSYFDDTLAHHFYDSLLILNLNPNLVKFGDQNKTKYVTKREEIEEIILKNFNPGIKNFPNNPLFEKIRKSVELRKKNSEINDIKRAKRKINIKYSKKYTPATSNRGKNLFIVEGLSAAGSILQERNPKTDGVYALKGKIKNVRNISDFKNAEILELMRILNLDLNIKNSIPNYENIIIASDQDPDGAHIASLLINFFYKWFPWIIENGLLYLFRTPLISIGNDEKKYFYSINEFNLYKGKINNIRYLKGLGSLSEKDWKIVMREKKMVKIKADEKSNELLEMAFGKSADERKKWLRNEDN